MGKRTSPLVAACAAAVLTVPVVAVFVAACSSSGGSGSGDSGARDARSRDAMGDTRKSTSDASCTVDAGSFSAAEVALGLSLVRTHRCWDCHGPTLSGNFDGVASPSVTGGLAYPPNLTSDPATGLGCWTNAQIENAILNGTDNEGMPLCPPMPRFGHLAGDGGLDGAGAQAVVAYLRSLAVVVYQVPDTPNCAAPSDGGADAGMDSGMDAGVVDSGRDARPESGADAHSDAAREASSDAGGDGGRDAARDAEGDAPDAGHTDAADHG